ncbi:salicylate synthase [Streptomyces sp. V2]|uniref:salicylate synthase n=1 Tax=Streptomyces TaxID=1883 RepID=UPI0007C7443C|nr:MULTISPECIES: salicylate synthase [Streptomyces]PWG12731.1 salicylate synthase [Streptomyces sp. V2]
MSSVTPTPSVRSASYDLLRPPLSGDPMAAAVRVARLAHHEPYVLYERRGVWSLALGVVAEVTVTPSLVRLSGPGGERTAAWQGHPGDTVRELLAELPVEDWRAYGTAAFELSFCGTPALADLPPDTALLRLVVPHTEIRIEAGSATVRALDLAQPLTRSAVAALAAADPAAGAAPALVGVDVERDESDLYRKAVAGAVREIQDSALRKVILSRVVRVPEPVDLVATYTHGRARNTPARSFLLHLGGERAAGFSPEIVLSVEADGRVRTQPLAGTRALTGSPGEDRRLREELLQDPKEVYEHAVSVRTSFDELEEICVPGSIRVSEYLTVKERGTAQHLASDLYGRLAPGRDCWAALAALFPAVTASGIPKPEAYDAIRRLESEPRGLYGGAVLTVGQDGTLDAALVLRSVYQREDRTWLRAGAGIVGQSTPEREFTETCEKLRSVSLSVVSAGAVPGDAVPDGAVPGGSRLTVEVMRRDIAETLRRPGTEIDPEESLLVQGLDSVGMMTLVSKWSAYGVRLRLADLARAPRLGAWAELVRDASAD